MDEKLKPKDKVLLMRDEGEGNKLKIVKGIDKKGKSIDNRNFEQKQSLRFLLYDLQMKFPDAKILGHRDFPNVHKDCPCFDAKKEYQNVLDVFG